MLEDLEYEIAKQRRMRLQASKLYRKLVVANGRAIQYRNEIERLRARVSELESERSIPLANKLLTKAHERIAELEELGRMMNIFSKASEADLKMEIKESTRQRIRADAAEKRILELETERICDECDGSGVYLIDHEPRECICTGSQTTSTNLGRALDNLKKLKDELHKSRKLTSDVAREDEEIITSLRNRITELKSKLESAMSWDKQVRDYLRRILGINIKSKYTNGHTIDECCVIEYRLEEAMSRAEEAESDAIQARTELAALRKTADELNATVDRLSSELEMSRTKHGPKTIQLEQECDQLWCIVMPLIGLLNRYAPVLDALNTARKLHEKRTYKPE